MRFISYRFNGKDSYGILHNEAKIISKNEISQKINQTLPENLLSFIIKFGTSLNSKINQLIPELTANSLALNRVQLTAPIKNPRRNVFCVGKNYLDHALEVNEFTNEDSASLSEFPIYFSKATDVLLGEAETIYIKENYAQNLDYEIELAVIIAKDGVNITKDEAQEYIFGYTISNDITARDVQAERGQWFKGKSLDNSLVIGPWIVGADEILFPPKLDVKTKINGNLRQHSNTSHFIFDLATIISDLSRGLTLRAGDIIMTGTPGGVGVAMQPPHYLKSGDIIQLEIENIGSLTNNLIFTN